jgi:DNA repair protein RadC
METQLPLFAAKLPASAQHTIREALTLLERQLREPGASFTSSHRPGLATPAACHAGA